jgi:polyvinyl alcohol dehydrogenase (cytochrome)
VKPRLLVVLALSCATFAQNGASIYRQHCAICHESPQGRTPSVDSLRAMSNAAILRALETGVMREQAKNLNGQERGAVAEYLHSASDKTANAVPSSAYCSTAATAASSSGSSWNGFGANLANTRFQSKDDAGISASDVPKLRLRWAFSLGDVTMARGQPVVVRGRLYAGAASGKLYSLDAKTGCVYWTFHADAPIRSGVMVGTAGPSAPAVFFGDMKTNAYAVDASSGKLLWKTGLDQHNAAMITAAPSFSDGTLYFGISSFEELAGAQPTYECCTFRGSVAAVEAATGKIIWNTSTIAQPSRPTTKTSSGVQRHGPSGAAVWATPTVDLKRNAIYISTGDNYSDPTTDTSDAVMALDRSTGEMLWSRQMTTNDAYTIDCAAPVKTNCPASNGPDFDFGQPPILVSLSNGKQALVIGQKSGVAYALDPDQHGKILWQTRIGKGGSLGGSEWGSAADESRMFVALSDIAFKVVKDPANPAGTKIALDPEKGGGIFALDLLTGNKIWSATPPNCGGREHCSPAQSAAVSAIPGVVFSGSVDGHFRAYSTSTGEILWDYDSFRDYDAVNGKAHGGAIDGGGPAIAGGMVYLYSGYNQWGGVPGNVLLAFSVDGK